jgi:hypothetical protein
MRRALSRSWRRDTAVRGGGHFAERPRLALVAYLDLGWNVGVLGLSVGDLAQHGWLLEKGHTTPTRGIPCTIWEVGRVPER